MKILMINSVCGIRSTGRICTDLADALTKQGHTVKIAYGREEVPEQYKKYAIRIGTDLDVRLHGVRARLLDESGFGSKKATIRFIEWVKKYDPDVIHLHNIHGYYINIEVLFDYLRTCGKKIIWTLHDCWAFTGHAAYCEAANCVRWETGCHNCPKIDNYPKSFYDNSKLNWLKKRKTFTGIPNLQIITPSKWLAGLVKKSFLRKYPVKVIYNGIDTSVFKPVDSSYLRKKLNIGDKKVILGVAAVWDARKGLNDFIKLNKLIDKNEYQIILVGLTEKQIANLPKTIIGKTRTNSTKELAAFYSIADVYLNTSKEETMGLTTVEAYACGTPVVVSNFTAVPEVVNKKCGLVLSSLNTCEIQRSIEKVLDSTWSGIEQEAVFFEKSNRYNEYIEKCYLL